MSVILHGCYTSIYYITYVCISIIFLNIFLNFFIFQRDWRWAAAWKWWQQRWRFPHPPCRRPAPADHQGWKFMSCSHCQELGQQANWLLIGCTRSGQSIRSQDNKFCQQVSRLLIGCTKSEHPIRSQVSKLTPLLTMTTTHKFSLLFISGGLVIAQFTPIKASCPAP